MGTENVDTFRSSVGGTATIHEVDADGFTETLTDVIEEPAVGTPLPFEDVSLESTPVVTDYAPSDLTDAHTGVTPATHAVANYGSVTLPSDSAGTELVSLYPDRHVVVLAASDVVADMGATFEALSADFEDGLDSQVLATGPSATADMGTLVHGVHGPNDVHVILLEDR